MMFDLTKEVVLGKKEAKTYRALRFAFYLLSLSVFFYVAFLVLFPTQSLTFSFLNSDASSNMITRPRNGVGTPIKNGKINASDNFSFDASLIGNYSKAKLTFKLSKKSEEPEFGSLQAVKSYQAFLYPEGSPLGFKDGTLMKNGQNYYIVSGGEFHKFQNLPLVNSLGFSEKAFIEASEADLMFNKSGFPVIDGKNFPESSMFKIRDDFYLLKNNELQKFISPEAFLSQYKPEQAMEKNESFLGRYKLSENFVGFSDGSLISYGDAVYLISEGKVFPVDSAITFEANGYDWQDVILVSADEISFYKKAKLFTLRDPHPTGTVFSTIEDGEFYIIKNGEKNILPTANIAYSWLRKNPILVSQNGSNISISCTGFKKDLFSFRSYSCEMETSALRNLIGKDYEFKSSFKNNIEFDIIGIEFKRTVTLENLSQTLGEILNRIKNNYVRQ
jgi:hypothetical protein